MVELIKMYHFQDVFDLYMLYFLLIGYISSVNMLGYTRSVKKLILHFLD